MRKFNKILFAPRAPNGIKQVTNLQIEDSGQLQNLNEFTRKYVNCVHETIVAKDIQILSIDIEADSVSDPDSVGSVSGSASGNVDLDPGTQKNRDKLAYKSTKIIKI